MNHIQQTSKSSTAESNGKANHPSEPLDLIGGPFAVIESDPGVFTNLTRKLGIRGLEVVEMYDIEPWAVDHLNPRGLIFCFLWRKDNHRPADFDDPAAERVWFANQLIDDACASHAILNVLLNCPDVELGEELSVFRKETEKMSAVMKGLAVSNSTLMRKAHNSLTRPADIRGSVNSLTSITLEAAKARKARNNNPPPSKRRKASVMSSKKSSQIQELTGKAIEPETEETYHFIGYVPAYGKVWELDGLKSGPLEVGELPSTSDPPHNMTAKGWMDVVRPALRMKMQKYGGAAEGGDNIRFSLLALVGDQYQKVSDGLELLKRERVALERRLDTVDNEWRTKADQELLTSASEIFSTSVQSSAEGRVFASDFGSRKMARDIAILDMPERQLLNSWEMCVRAAIPAKVATEDEVAKSLQANTDHVKRTHDYEPFFHEFVTCLHNEGLLHALLDQDDRGKKPAIAKKGKANGKVE